MVKSMDELMKDYTETLQFQTAGGGEFTDITAIEGGEEDDE